MTAPVAITLGMIVLFSLREVFYEWGYKATNLKRVDGLLVSAVMFTLVCGIALAHCIWKSLFGDLTLLGQGAGWGYLLLIAYTCILWPAAYLAILTPLGASRASLLDWGAFPLFGAALDIAVEGSATQLAGPGRVVGTLIILLGFTGALASLTAADSGARRSTFWPSDTRPSRALVYGVCLAMVSALFGVLVFHQARRIVLSDQDASVVLLARSLPIALILLGCHLARERRPWRRNRRRALRLRLRALSRPGCILVLTGAAGLFYASVYILFDSVLRKSSVGQVTTYFFLLPVCSFLLSIFPFRLRDIKRVPRLEGLGMAGVVVGYLVWQLTGTANGS